MIDYSEGKIRICSNCREEKVNEDRQTFIYRDWLGNNCDACLTPLCDKCIELGWYEKERWGKKLYVGTERRYQEPEEERYW